MQAIGERWFLIEPLLFSLWTTHHVVMEPRIQTIRVGRGRIEYNPAFIDGLDARDLESVMRCEAVRILLKHPYERRKPSSRLAYLASNVTLQEYLQTSLPWPRASDLFGTDSYDRQSFDFYYQRLEESGWEGTLARTSGLSAYADAEQVGSENAQGWEADELFENRIDDQIRLAQEAQGWGSVGGALREAVLANLNPPLDYRAILGQFRASLLSTQRRLTRMRPSRRYGFASMGSRYDFTTRLLVAVDVSGSMSSGALSHGFSVVNQFFRYGVRGIDVLWFDTEVKGPPVALTRACARFELTGRGGTDLGAPLAYIDEHREWDGLIVFTDGQAPPPSPPRNRRTRVLWIFDCEENFRGSPLRPGIFLARSRS